MLGRFLCGMSIGCYSFILLMYVGEISTNEMRGAMLAMFQLMMCFGVLFVYVVGNYVSLKILNIICGSISVLYSLIFLALPESPSLLISHNRDDEAKQSLKVLRGQNYNYQKELDDLKLQHKEREDQKKTFTEVFKTASTLKAFGIVMIQFFFRQTCGINVVLQYSTVIFIQAGIDLEAGISSIIVATVQVISTFLAVKFVDRFGRKVLLGISNSFMCLALIGIGVFFSIADSSKFVDNLGWLPVTSLSISVIAYAFGVGPVSYILLGEFFKQDAKTYIAPIGQTFNLLLLFAVGLTFPMLSTAIGNGPSFFMFAGFCFLALNFVYFVIPETKGMSLSEIQDILK